MNLDAARKKCEVDHLKFLSCIFLTFLKYAKKKKERKAVHYQPSLSISICCVTENLFVIILPI